MCRSKYETQPYSVHYYIHRMCFKRGLYELIIILIFRGQQSIYVPGFDTLTHSHRIHLWFCQMYGTLVTATPFEYIGCVGCWTALIRWRFFYILFSHYYFFLIFTSFIRYFSSTHSLKVFFEKTKNIIKMICCMNFSTQHMQRAAQQSAEVDKWQHGLYFQQMAVIERETRIPFIGWNWL